MSDIVEIHLESAVVECVHELVGERRLCIGLCRQVRSILTQHDPIVGMKARLRGEVLWTGVTLNRRRSEFTARQLQMLQHERHNRTYTSAEQALRRHTLCHQLLFPFLASVPVIGHLLSLGLCIGRFGLLVVGKS